MTTNTTADTAARAALDAYAIRQVARGHRVEPLSDTSFVLVKQKQIRHVTHLVLTLCTGGFWGVVWLLAVLRNKPHRSVVMVDEFGRITEQ
jgi:hypothetical protein